MSNPVDFLRQRFHETTKSVDRQYTLNRPAIPANMSNGQAQPKFNIAFVTQEKLEKNKRKICESHDIESHADLKEF